MQDDRNRTKELLEPAGLPAAEPLEFAPPRWLKSRHVQSILPSLPLRRPGVRRRVAAMLQASRELLLDCGAGVRLLGHLSARGEGAGSSPRFAVLLHGWEGSADSNYLLSVAGALYDRGWDVLRLNLRDHGDTHHLNPELFHSCRLDEVIGAIRHLQRLRPDVRPALAGFSLGGNFCLRVAARAGTDGLRLGRVVAVCPVLDPRVTLRALEEGPALYREYFILKWKRSLRKKQAAWPDRYRFDDLLAMRSLQSMTDAMVRRYTEFPDLEAYLSGYAITGEALAALETPCHLITAADDPIVLAGDLQRLRRVPALTVTVTPHGGHCGFVDTLSGNSWIDRAIVADLERHWADAAAVTVRAAKDASE